MQIATERLILAPLCSGDTADLFKVRGDPLVMEFWDWPHDPDLDATECVVATMLSDMASGKVHCFSVRTRDACSFVGLIDLSDVNPSGSAELGFMLARVHWNKGFAREAAAALIEHARGLGLQHLAARIHSGNTRSARLLAALGFVEADPSATVETRPGVRVECRRFRLDLRTERALSDGA